MPVSLHEPFVNKKLLRREIKNRLAQIPAEEFSAAGSLAAAFVRASPLWKQNDSVLLFLSAKDEIDTHPLLKTALEDGKAVFVPRVKNKKMFFCRISELCGPWGIGTYGIKEPLSDIVLETADFPALIFTPGLAFDRQGNRLGRGGGYYDRFLSSLDESKLEYAAAGFCLDFQIQASVPADAMDKRVSFLATEKGFAVIGS